MSQDIQQPKWYTIAFEQFEKSLNGQSESPLHQLRRSAFDTFNKLGFPTNRHEEWRFTNVSAIAKTNFKPFLKNDLPKITNDDIQPYLLSDQNSHLLVFVNGHFVPELSDIQALPKGMRVQNLASALKENRLDVNKLFGNLTGNNPFDALNTAFIQDGAYILLEDGIASELPIHCLFIATAYETPFAVHPRNLIRIGKNSQVKVVESYIGKESNCYLTNAVTEISLSEDALVEYTKFQNESEHAFHISTIQVHQEGKSAFTSNSVSLGGGIVRNNILAKLDGEFIECTLNGLSLGMQQQLVDNHTTIDHAKPNCASHELYKSILGGKARGVFNGKIFVRKDAQKTDAKQTNKTLLLSVEAIIDTKPQLEIFADDVKCTHGATVGQLDQEQIFYLRSRGFGLELARDVLTTAFANDIIDRISNESLRRKLYDLIFQRLHEGRTSVEA